MHRQAYEVDYIICEAAVRRLKEMLNGGKIPAAARLKDEIEALISEKTAFTTNTAAQRTSMTSLPM